MPTTGTAARRLRYAGRCAGCGDDLAAGTSAHYDRADRTVRCAACGVQEAVPVPVAEPDARLRTALPRAAQRSRRPARPTCDDCGRRLVAGELVEDDRGTAASTCRECVLLDLVHVVGLPGAGARAEFDRRVGKREKRIRTQHPRLGGLILALSDDPQSTRAWAVGAVGEEEFGSRLSSMAGPGVTVLHDRKRQGSRANIDHLVVTSRGVWVLDAKKHSGRIEARGHGLFSRRPPDLYVNGRDRSKDVTGVAGQVAHVTSVLAGWTTAPPALPRPPVRGALVYVDGDFGVFASPFEVGGVLVTWGKDVRGRLAAEVDGPYDPVAIAKHLAAALRPGVATSP